jgi:hypothetical protein
MGTLFTNDRRVKRTAHAAGGRMVITRMSVSLIRTGHASPCQYRRKLLQRHCSGTRPIPASPDCDGRKTQTVPDVLRTTQRRHPEGPRFHQRDEGSCAQRNRTIHRHRTANVHSSQTTLPLDATDQLHARSLTRLVKAPRFGMTQPTRTDLGCSIFEYNNTEWQLRLTAG